MKEKFDAWKPHGKSLVLIQKIQSIMDEYHNQGYALTLRQLYYQLVSRDIIPNNINEYKKIGHVVNHGRLSALLDWSMIEDRIRIPKGNQHWTDPKQVIDAAINSYYRHRWEGQEYYIEVWCEKDAVSNILEPVCRLYDVVFLANRGYSSQTAMYDASKRIQRNESMGKTVKIIYLGDHDPSGIDMVRDIQERLGLFLNCPGKYFEDVNRLALNRDQVRRYNPPENPAKIQDSRYLSYVKKFGKSSWELDALEPKILHDMLTNLIKSFIDFNLWDQVIDLENEHKNKISELADKWEL